PWVMLIPLLALSVGAVAAGFAFDRYFIGASEAPFWGTALPQTAEQAAHAESPAWVAAAPTWAMLLGFALALTFYIAVPALPAIVATVFKPLYVFLLNKWYFDELYDALFVRPAKWLGRVLWLEGDGAIIDGLGPDGVAQRVLWTTG